MSTDTQLEVVERAFSIEEPWRVPAGVGCVTLVGSSDGSPARLETRLHVFHDSVRLYCVFEGSDDLVLATHTLRDAPLWEEDVVEMFLSPSDPARYLEFEVSPRGAVFDAAIHSPEGTRATMQVDRRWDCRELFAAVQYEHDSKGTSRFATVVAIPFACASLRTPAPGDRWRANFFRIDRHPMGDEFTAWRPTGKSPPDFHVPAAFGELIFR